VPREAALLVQVLLSDRQRVVPPAAPILKAMVRRVVETETAEIDEVGVVLGDDRLLRDLNARYRGKPHRTDVLSFPMESGGPYRVLGEIVISTDRAVAQARARRLGLAEEVARLLVHGLLHLFGYEHGTESGRRRMRRREVERLSDLRPLIEKLAHRYASVRM
jgi:probable rRNA maturation factor